jgi:hypothetical protein
MVLDLSQAGGTNAHGVGARIGYRQQLGYDGVRQFALALQRTEFGRALLSIRLRTVQPMATSVG